ncbi:MAG: putative nucleic acid-binding protein, contains PIN domain [Candidatus Electronema aureum]|uniref:Nucleic acid-binding protein, contains PIN domain n=1 Tax=Candidatus Electronema aureum TaxID=2005002 RepID=A0A521G339_9BACT|nr:MAG: putative nucleic acid-binding protein, contains PIN domain [Candidatus Electronema aureum]
MSDRFFTDTNILVYSMADDLRKREIAEELLLQDGVVMSPQVISEFVAVTLRKRILEPEKVLEYARKFLHIFQITATNADTVATALDVMAKYHFSYWDSLILAAALESSCAVVYSEDLQTGQQIQGRLTIVNPFK